MTRIELDEAQVGRLERLRRRDGLDRTGAITKALDLYEEALGHAELLPPAMSNEQVGARVAAGLEASRLGQLSPHREVFDRLRARRE